MKKRLISIFKTLQIPDYILVGILGIYLVLQINLLSAMQQLAAPIYGGDLYFSMGSVSHVLFGGNPFQGSNVLNSPPAYFPLYAIIVSIFGWIFKLTAFNAMKLFSTILMVSSSVVIYILAGKILKNKYAGLMAVLLYVPVYRFPIFKYTDFSVVLIAPIFIFTMYWFYLKRTWLSAIIMGLVFGLIGITHSIHFINAAFLFALLSIYVLLLEPLMEKNWKLDKSIVNKANLQILYMLILSGAIGSIIAMLCWYEPIFVYHGKIYQSYLYLVNYSGSKGMLAQSWELFKARIFDFSSVVSAIRSIFTIIGIILLFIISKYRETEKFLAFILAATTISVFHYIITDPLLGVNFQPGYMLDFSLAFALLLCAGFAINYAASLAGKYKSYVLIVLIVFTMGFTIMQFNKGIADNTYMATAKSPLPPNLAATQAWVVSNTSVNDVFVSTNELSFALNALTGRKEVAGRKSHNSVFFDVDSRQAAAAIILYGNDTAERKRLLKELSVDYLYWDYYWIQSDFIFDQDGKLVSWYDPFLVEDTPKYNDLIQKYGLKNVKQNTWPDPALKSDYWKKIDLIIFLPYEFNPVRPWNPDLENYTQEVWNYSQNGVTLTRMYKIVNLD